MPKIRETGDFLTEKINPNTLDIDSKSTVQIVETIIAEDGVINKAISDQKTNISHASDLILESLSSGGRLFFVWAAWARAEALPTLGARWRAGHSTRVMASGTR